jgi:hypothetical protein
MDPWVAKILQEQYKDGPQLVGTNNTVKLATWN